MGKWSVPHPAKTSVAVTCHHCGAQFETPAWKVAQGKGKFCSKSCYRLASRNPDGFEVDGLWFSRQGKNNYYWCKSPSVSLHRYIWEKFNGPVPAGFHIHHKDHNTANNDISNLELVEVSEHGRYHLQHRIANGGLDTATALKKAQEAAKAWHKSEEGREWHRQHAIESAKSIPLKDHVCTQCGKTFKSKHTTLKKSLCSPNCISAYRRASGVDAEKRVCTICGESFTVNKYSKTKTCSEVCKTKQMLISRKGRKPLDTTSPTP